jgi:hypothetical protein
MTQQQTQNKQLTEATLLGLLLLQRGATFITFTSVTDARAKKTAAGKPVNPHFKDCFKVSDTNGQINFHYDIAVLNRLAKEGKTEAEFERGGSYHVPVLHNSGALTPLCVHKEDAAKVVGWASRHTDIKDGRPFNVAENKPIPLAECEVNTFHVTDIVANPTARLYLRFRHLNSIGEPSYITCDGKPIATADIAPYLPPLSTYDNQGTDDPIRFLTYSLDSIVHITVDGVSYTVSHPTQVPVNP